MKRFFSILLALLLLPAVFPHGAKGETQQFHTIEADEVLIYNPLPYDANGNSLFTGTISQNEDGEPTGDVLFTPGLHRTGKDLSTGRKDPRTRDFWVCTDLMTYRYDKRTFVLAQESEHCCIWTMDGDSLSFTEEQTAAMLEQFEKVIYPTDTAYFGGFRALGDGKLQILTYSMNSTSVCGFFDSYDLYTYEEIQVIDPDDSESYNYLPIINVNARMADRESVVYGTLAHEFQHLILRSAVLASPANEGRLGRETTVGTWLNEGFSMAAEELCYPGSVAEQGYVDAFARSDKIRYGMSYQNFDATSTDVGAYGQSYLFTAYLCAQCGDGVFRDSLDYWRSASEQSALTEAKMIRRSLSDEQIASLEALCTYGGAVESRLGSESEILLSKLALAFRLAIVLKKDSGLLSIGTEKPVMPVYTGSGRRIEGGGAILVECGNTFRVPADADSGLVFVGLKNGAITEVYSAPEPEEGYYVIAAESGSEWRAIPAAPARTGIIKPAVIEPNPDGTVDASAANGFIFEAVRTADGFRFVCDDENGTYALSRTGSDSQSLTVSESDGTFAWTHFADGCDRLQADGFYGRAILFGSYQGGFGYFAPAYFAHASFAKPRLLRVVLMRGDANLDGKVTAADAALVLRTVVGLSYMNAPMRSVGDLNGDGEITATDAVTILRLVVNLED
jgi:hypothetical protein